MRSLYEVEQTRYWRVAAESPEEALEIAKALEPSEVQAAEVTEIPR